MFHKALFILCFLLISPSMSGQSANELFSAVKENNIEKVDSIFQTELNISALINEEGEHIIPFAIQYADSTLLSKIWDKHPSLHYEGNFVEFYSLVDVKKNVWLGDLVSLAAYFGKIDNMSFLKKKDHNINEQRKSNNKEFSLWTPIMHAVYSKQNKAVKWLIENGADLSLKNEEGKSVIDLCDNPALKSFLLENDQAKLDDLISLDSLFNNILEADISGDYVLYSELSLEAVEIAKKLYGNSSPHYAYYLDYVSFGYAFTSQLEKAIVIIEEALVIAENYFGKRHNRYSSRLNNLAYMYNSLGDYSATYRILLQVEEVMEAEPDKDEDFMLGVATLKGNMGVTLKQMGEYDKALQYASEALEICRANKLTTVFDSLNHLSHISSIYTEQEKYEKALELLRITGKAFEKELGEEHPVFLENQSAISVKLFYLGRTNEAVAILDEIIEVAEKNPTSFGDYLGYYYWNRGRFLDSEGKHERANKDIIQSLKIAKETSGTNNDVYGKRLSGLAQNYVRLKKMNLADETILEMLSNVTYNLINRLPFLPESSQLSHLKSYYEKQNFVNCHFKDRRLPKEVFEFNNLMNGFTLRNLRSIKSENEYYPKWKSLKEKIAKELSLPTESRNILLPDWKRELVLLESNNLFPISLMKPSSLSCEELKENLKTDEILISFDRFNYFTHHKIDSVFYFARIILPEADDIKQEFLFEERELENLMRKDKSRRADYVARLYNYQNRGVEVEDNERSLFEMIWEPLQPYMKGKNKMHINVSGLLHEINLGAISISEDEVLADVINPVLLSNLNEIQETKRDYKNDFLLVGGLHYDEYKEDLVDPSERTNTTTTNPWKYLKWTAKEVKNIEEQLHTNEEWSGKVLRSKEGTEGAVKSLLKKNHSPRIVHFSTHGYFFSEPDTTQLAYYAQSSNPMIRSGLILSNGNLSWTSLSTKNPHGEDNILTAAEIQSLNLKDTELVVLSACETGLGEVKGSEGVFGMQRAFKLAGAKNIIMSLWQIPDRESSDFMIAFYKHYLEDNLSIRDAFYQTQKEMKDRFYNPYNWAGFVLIE